MSTISASTATNTAYKVTADTTGTLVLQTGATPTTAVTIDGSQNVGIGTSSMTGAGNLFLGGAYAGIYYNNATGNMFIGSTTATPLAFGTNLTERMRIDSSGNLLVGTTATVNAAKSVFSFSSSNNGVYVVDSTGVSGAQFMRFDSTSNTCGQITRVGATSAVLYNTSSDYRLKENPTPLTGALERVAALKPVQWVWKDCDGAVGEGFIAHEVQKVIPSAVTGEKDAVDADGKPQYQGMDASYLVATLTAAIQELKAELDAVKAQLQGAA